MYTDFLTYCREYDQLAHQVPGFKSHEDPIPEEPQAEEDEEEDED